MKDNLLIVFVGILALMVVLQSLYFLGVFIFTRRIYAWLQIWGKEIQRNAEHISAKVDEGVTSIQKTAESLKPITQNLVGITQVVHNRVVDLNGFIDETTTAARREILRIQDTVQYASRRTEEAIDMLRDSILAPINEVNAIVRAVRMGLDVLFRRRRNPSNVSVPDEEMFI
jgi:hypothetical protein